MGKENDPICYCFSFIYIFSHIYKINVSHLFTFNCVMNNFVRHRYHCPEGFF